MARWPTSIDVLSADDIGPAPLEDAAGRRDLFGWVYMTFPGDTLRDSTKRDLLVRTLFAAARELDPDRSVGLDELSPEMQARVWNRAVASLGYVNGNPES